MTEGRQVVARGGDDRDLEQRMKWKWVDACEEEGGGGHVIRMEGDGGEEIRNGSENDRMRKDSQQGGLRGK